MRSTGSCYRKRGKTQPTKWVEGDLESAFNYLDYTDLTPLQKRVLDSTDRTLGFVVPGDMVVFDLDYDEKLERTKYSVPLMQRFCKNSLHQESLTEDNAHFFKVPPERAQFWRGMNRKKVITRCGLVGEVFPPHTHITVYDKRFYGTLEELPYFLEPLVEPKRHLLYDKTLRKSLNNTPLNFISESSLKVVGFDRHRVIKGWMMVSYLAPEVLWDLWCYGTPDQNALQELRELFTRHHGFPPLDSSNPYYDAGPSLG